MGQNRPNTQGQVGLRVSNDPTQVYNLCPGCGESQQRGSAETYKEEHLGLEHHSDGSWRCDGGSTGRDGETELDIPLQLCSLVRELQIKARQAFIIQHLSITEGIPSALYKVNKRIKILEGCLN